MIIFTKFFFLNLFLFNYVFSNFLEISENFSIHRFFPLFFVLIIFLNYYMNLPNQSKPDLDLVYKFFIFLLKTPNYFLNYVLNTIKKIYIYLFHFKFRYFKNSVKIMFRKQFNNIFLIWKPLFKKTSYFGYYRSNRSKWIK